MVRWNVTITERVTVTVELEDITQVPRKYLKLNDALIQAEIDAGVRDIPGIRIFNVYETLLDWYTARVAQLLAAGQRSSAAEDWQAAQDKFPRWARGEKYREIVRTLRRALVPAEWRRKGRPRNRKSITTA